MTLVSVVTLRITAFICRILFAAGVHPFSSHVIFGVRKMQDVFIRRFYLSHLLRNEFSLCVAEESRFWETKWKLEDFLRRVKRGRIEQSSVPVVQFFIGWIKRNAAGRITFRKRSNSLTSLLSTNEFKWKPLRPKSCNLLGIRKNNGGIGGVLRTFNTTAYQFL